MVDHDVVVAAARGLDIRPRGERWAHLSLCVLDAVFSIGARYGSTERTCKQYAAYARLAPLVDAAAPGSIIGTPAEQPLSAFVTDAADVERFASEVLRNRQRTSTRGGVLKAEAAARYAQVLVDAGVQRYGDVPGLFDDEPRMAAVTTALRGIAGNGTSDVRLGYLWMLLGDDHVIKPDRMVLRWLAGVLGRRPTAADARAMIGAAAGELGCTPWELDHAVWRAQRGRRLASSDSATVRLHRAHQSRWRETELKLPAGAPTSSRTRATTVKSMLPHEHDGVSAADAGWNLLSPAAREYARARVPVVKAAHGVVETDRLWRKMLSSQPLAFSVVGELRAHPRAAVAVLSELTGRQLSDFARVDAGGEAYGLDGLQAEWAPPRAEHTGDRSGFDIAAAVRAADGRWVLITVEVKYVDTFSSAKLNPDDYRDALERVGMNIETAQSLVDSGASQFLRSVLLTESVRRGGTSGRAPFDEAVAVVLSRDDDATAASVVRLVRRAQAGVPVQHWGLRRFTDAAARQTDLAAWANRLRARYLLAS